MLAYVECLHMVGFTSSYSRFLAASGQNLLIGLSLRITTWKAFCLRVSRLGGPPTGGRENFHSSREAEEACAVELGEVLLWNAGEASD